MDTIDYQGVIAISYTNKASNELKNFKLEYSGEGSKIIYQSPEAGYYVKEGATIKLMLGN